MLIFGSCHWKRENVEMKKDDFSIGLEFYTGSGKWRCTDVGTRVIVAIKLDADDPRNYLGPPYST